MWQRLADVVGFYGTWIHHWYAVWGASPDRLYELHDHLGNVRATVGMTPPALYTNKVPVIDYYNYYAFGSYEPYRTLETDDVAFGFNGKEKKDDWRGAGNSYDYGMRDYDTRIGRFFKVDPLSVKYPMLSPYQYASNCPISGVDLNGLEFYYTANGALLGHLGRNNSVRLVNEGSVANVRLAINMGHAWKTDAGVRSATNFANNFSKDVGLTNDELNTRAFLGTIRQTEGGGKKLSYDTRFGNFKLKDLDDHPMSKSTRWGKSSSASGAYEILSGTWVEVKGKLKLTNFQPESQDAAAVQIIKDAGALDFVKNGDITNAFNKLKTTWSSFPGASEEGMKAADAAKAFISNLVNELKNKSDLATPQGKLKIE